MIMETIADLFKQLGCGAQVDMSGTDAYMAHIGGQGREPGVDILLVPVPCQQSMHGKGMPQVMDTWTGVFVVGDAALFKQLPEGVIDCAVTQAVSPAPLGRFETGARYTG